MQPGQTPMTVEEYQARQDADNLRTLEILSVVYGVLAFLCSGFPLLYIFMGFQMVNNPAFFGSPMPGPNGFTPGPPPGFGYIFVFMGVIAMLYIWVMAGLALHAAKCIRHRRNWTWVMVSACVDCLHVPLGTALGVFTIIVINRPSVRQLFDRQLFDQQSIDRRFV